MKKLIILILVVAAGYFAYQKFVGNVSDEQKQVQTLSAEFAAIKQQMTQAERAAGVSGMDMTSDAGSSMAAAESVLKRLRELMENLTDEKALKNAAELEGEMRTFLDRG